MERFVAERGLQRATAEAKVASLRGAGLVAYVESDGALFRVELDASGAARKAMQRLTDVLACHAIVLEAARREGIKIEPYKSLEKSAIVAGLARAARAIRHLDVPRVAAILWHELVWAQGLPNANHRSALLFLELWFNRPGGPVRFDPAASPAWAEALVRGSKPLILDKEFAPNPARAKEKHRDYCLRAFQAYPNLGDGR